MDRTRLGGMLGLELALGALLVWIGPRPDVVRAAATDPQGWLETVGPDTAAITAVGLLCFLTLVWITVGLLLVMAAALPGTIGRVADAIAARAMPSAVRRAATAALGLSLGTAVVAGTASADPGPNVGRHVVPYAEESTASVLHAYDRRQLPPASSASNVDWPLDPAPAESPPQRRGDPAPRSRASGGGADSAGPTTPERGAPGSVDDTAASKRGDPGSTRSVPDAHPRSARPHSGSADPRGSAPATRAPTCPSATARDGQQSTSRPHAQASGGVAAAPSVVVRPGDSLWLIAAKRLGPDAEAAEIACEWPRWYAANRDAIGPDPNLIQPGRALVAPLPFPGTGSNAASADRPAGPGG